MKKENQSNPSHGGRGPGKGFGMGRPVEKAENFKESLKRLIGYLKPQAIKIIAVFFLAAISTAFNIISPKVMGSVTNKIVEDLRNPSVTGLDFNYIWRMVLVLIGLYFLSSLFNYSTGYMMSEVAQKTVYTLRRDVKEKLDRLPLKYFDSHTHGEILSRITNDLDTVGNTLQQSLTQLITAVITLLGIAIMMLTISPVLTVITITTIPISALATIIITKKSQKLFVARQAALGRLNGHVEEMYAGHKVVKVFNYEDKSIDRFNEINEELYNAGWKAEFISGTIMPLLSFINNIGYVLICVVGGIFVAMQKIQVGDIQAFIQYARQFTHPIVQTANISNILQSTVASAERVFHLLDEVEEVPDKEDAKIIEFPRGEVEFKHVQFGYDEGTVLIKDMNIHVKKGQTIAIVGPTGAGKTTLVNLLMRFYELNRGSITIDGIDIRDIKRQNLRNLLAWYYRIHGFLTEP